MSWGDWRSYLSLWSASGSKAADSPKPSPAPTPPVSGVREHSSGLPSAVPVWATGTGFGTRSELNLGEVSVVEITRFEQVWNSGTSTSGASYFSPANIPDGYHSLGSYGELNSEPLRGWVLAIAGSLDGQSPALARPRDYTLLWSSADWATAEQDILAFFWAPVVPSGYKALGFLITNSPDKPGLNDIALVREDLTTAVAIDNLLWNTSALGAEVPPFSTYSTKPAAIGLTAQGISVNTVYCDPHLTAKSSLSVACLSNVNRVLDVMPTFEQLGQILREYGPTVFFYPEEKYLPATPQWFFDRGALLYTATNPSSPVRVEEGGANLPAGGSNDGAYWLDLPNDGTRETIKKGNLPLAKVFVHVKPMFGATMTDISCWIYYTFNGSSIARVGALLKTLTLGKVGEHVGDWEHFVLRVDNFSGELRRVYLAAHSGGTWFRPDQLEFMADNRPAVYSANTTHAMYAKPGDNLQGGDSAVKVGLRNDTARSTLTLDASRNYQFINVDYLGAKGETGYPAEPAWAGFMREWGPTIIYDSKTEIERVVGFLPSYLRKSVMNLIGKLPVELGGEEGPTGPKEKASWLGDEK